MATFKVYYSKSMLSEGKETKVLIRVTQNGLHSYPETGYYISPSQVSEDFKIKDEDFNTTILNIRKRYINWVKEGIGEDIGSYTAADIKAYIEKKRKGDTDIDFFEFAEKFIAEHYKGSTAAHSTTSLNGFRDFLKVKTMGCNALSRDTLKKFSEYLKKPRVITRKDQYGIERTRTYKALNDYGVGEYIADLKAIFNAARDVYNDEETGDYRIKKNPFKNFEIKVKGKATPRNIPVEAWRKIIDMPDTKFDRVNMARDVLLISLMLCGTNTVDLYAMNEYKNGRISYKRTKTKDRRHDQAYMSIKVEPEVLSLIEKYRDPTGERVFIFYKKYADAKNFGTAINKGLKVVKEECNIGIDSLTTYVARHSVATIMRNKLGISKSDVDEILNHVDPLYKIADVYIERDFSIVDKANRKFLNYLFQNYIE